MTRAAKTTARKPVAMCCVTIGFDRFLMPADKGMKVFELMQSAIKCELGYGEDRHTYAPGEAPEVECKVVRPDQVRPRTRQAHDESAELFELPAPMRRLTR
ncbi:MULTISPECIES: hypothetical protein [unclassified Variovorax]|uniref:hypothetical protein n=1 Tax=unclassified Variovorax TaxID=663243 RepID=UPI003F457172